MGEIGGVLGEIVARKRLDVAERLRGLTIEVLRLRASKTERSLKAALSKPGARFIMEVKRSSPSAGALREGADPAALARAYRGAADAISVLTDQPYFGGSFDDLRIVREQFDGPILAKDFIVDPRQVPEARNHGADAVLVMLSVLDDASAREIMAEAASLGMDALVEAHDEAEVLRAVALGAEIIGINNRNLKTLEVDLRTTERLSSLVPEDRILVAESGIQNRQDVDRLSAFADAFLVGSSLMRADDVALAARELAFGRVKVCGVTNRRDMDVAVDAGAAFIGLVMVPNTPRAISVNEAQCLAQAAGDAKLVGVFRNEKLMDVAAAAKRLGLHAVQLHGEEDASYIKGLRNMLPDDVQIWTAGGVTNSVPEARPGSDRTLFDTAVGGRSGGTGKLFDWALLENHDGLDRAIVAGGLKPDNARAASKLGAFALDVGSGLEAEPGRKDPQKVRAFFDALRLPVRKEIAGC